MLVLSRKQKETIMIGDDIEIVVVSVEGEQVKLGINAPKHIDIHRKEIYVDIQNENSNAAILPEYMIKKIKNTKKD